MAEPALVQAAYAFKGANNDELCFRKGDVITVTRREEGGWWEGTLRETTGWFPSGYVREHRGAPAPPARAPAELQAFRDLVLRDILDSERAHVDELRALGANFLRPLETADIVAKDEYKQLTGNIFQVLQTHEELLSLIEECGAKTGSDQRVGGLFLRWAPKVETVHQTYCSSHPRAVCILDKYKDELNAFMEKCGAVNPGLLVLTAGLSKPFRRLDKYAAMLQELGRHVIESHPDRGDTHRAVAVYKDIAAACSATRRQKELELQVVTGAVRGWQGSKDLTSLGEVLHMGGVALGETHADRYFVLFPSTLLILSVSRRMSAFVYEGSLPLTGIAVTKLEDAENRKNAFEISGSLIDTIIAVCQSNSEAEKWVNLLMKYSSPNQTAVCTSLPHSPTQISPLEKPNKTESLGGTTNHKRSHSFNNHYSYTNFLQHQNFNDYHNEKNNRIQTSCDALLTQKSSPVVFTRGPSTSISINTTSDHPERFSINSNTFKGWCIKNLRPAPPLRPMTINSMEDVASNTCHPYSPLERKVNSYEEDALILRVIEAYSTSARSRNTVNSEWDDDLPMKANNDWLVRSPSLPLHYTSKGSPGLWNKFFHLETDVKYLKNELKILRAELEDVRHEKMLSTNILQTDSNILRDAKESKC